MILEFPENMELVNIIQKKINPQIIDVNDIAQETHEELVDYLK